MAKHAVKTGQLHVISIRGVRLSMAVRPVKPIAYASGILLCALRYRYQVLSYRVPQATWVTEE